MMDPAASILCFVNGRRKKLIAAETQAGIEYPMPESMYVSIVPCRQAKAMSGARSTVPVNRSPP